MTAIKLHKTFLAAINLLATTLTHANKNRNDFLIF